MLVKREFHNIECDCCGQLLDEETWWDDQDALTTTILPECGWIECEGGRHYCDETVPHGADKGQGALQFDGRHALQRYAH